MSKSKHQMLVKRKTHAADDNDIGYESLEFELPNGLKGRFEITESGEVIEAQIDLTDCEEGHIYVQQKGAGTAQYARGCSITQKDATWASW